MGPQQRDLAIEEARDLGHIPAYEEIPYEFQIEEGETPQQYFDRLCTWFTNPEQQAFLRLFFNLMDIDEEIKYILNERALVEHGYHNPTRYQWVSADRDVRLTPWLIGTIRLLVSEFDDKLAQADSRRILGEEYSDYERILPAILEGIDKPIDSRLWRVWIHGLSQGFKDLNLWVDIRGLTAALKVLDRDGRPVLRF